MLFRNHPTLFTGLSYIHDGSVPFGDRFYSKKRDLSVVKQKEIGDLYWGTERNLSNRTGFEQSIHGKSLGN